MSDIVIFEGIRSRSKCGWRGILCGLHRRRWQGCLLSKHLKNIYVSGELEQEVTVSKLETVQKEGRRTITLHKLRGLRILWRYMP